MAFMIDIYCSMEDHEINQLTEKKEFIDFAKEALIEDSTK